MISTMVRSSHLLETKSSRVSSVTPALAKVLVTFSTDVRNASSSVISQVVDIGDDSDAVVV